MREKVGGRGGIFGGGGCRARRSRRTRGRGISSKVGRGTSRGGSRGCPSPAEGKVRSNEEKYRDGVGRTGFCSANSESRTVWREGYMIFRDGDSSPFAGVQSGSDTSTSFSSPSASTAPLPQVAATLPPSSSLFFFDSGGALVGACLLCPPTIKCRVVRNQLGPKRPKLDEHDSILATFLASVPMMLLATLRSRKMP